MENHEPLSYEEAFQELKNVVEELERGEIGVDQLVEKVKRATWLCQFLQDRLRRTEEEIQVIFREIEEGKME